MTASLSQDLRRRLVRAVDAGCFARAKAARFEVSHSAAIKLVRHARATGSTEPAKIGNERRPLLAGRKELLRQLATTPKGITLAAIGEVFSKRGIEPGSVTTI